MKCVKYFLFSAAVRGFHYYRKFWLTELEQTLNCFQEEGNTFDRFGIKCKRQERNYGSSADGNFTSHQIFAR